MEEPWIIPKADLSSYFQNEQFDCGVDFYGVYTTGGNNYDFDELKPVSVTE